MILVPMLTMTPHWIWTSGAFTLVVGFCAAVGVTVGIAVGTFVIVRIGNVIESLERRSYGKKGHDCRDNGQG